MSTLLFPVFMFGLVIFGIVVLGIVNAREVAAQQRKEELERRKEKAAEGTVQTDGLPSEVATAFRSVA